MELELKHIQSYPLFGDNGLKVFSNYWSKNKKIGICSISCITNESDNNIGLIGKDKFERYDHIRNIKPLLLPMSSLYTEMEDGKVPIVELFLLTCRNKSEFTKDEIIHQSLNDGQAIIAHYKKRELLGFELNTRSFFGAHGGKPCSVANQLYLFTYLFENHFDVFGLIDKGLAIDKRSVK